MYFLGVGGITCYRFLIVILVVFDQIKEVLTSIKNLVEFLLQMRTITKCLIQRNYWFKRFE